MRLMTFIQVTRRDKEKKSLCMQFDLSFKDEDGWKKSESNMWIL